MKLDAVDREIIQQTQAGLPLVSKPYHAIAEKIGITAQEVIRRITCMQEHGIIRRIAAIPNHYRLGYRYNGMTVWDVDDQFIDEMGVKIGQLNFVSHCYHRPRYLPEWPYNLFAMVHSKTEQEIKVQIDVISEILGPYSRGHTVLYSTRILKKTGLRIKNNVSD